MTTIVLPRTLNLEVKGNHLFQLEADLVCEVRGDGDNGPVATVNSVMVEGANILDCGDDLLEAIGKRIKTEAEYSNDFQAAAVDKAGYVMRGDPRDPSSKWEGPRL